MCLTIKRIAMSFKSLSFFLLLFIVVFASCQSEKQGSDGGSDLKEIVIISTNDMHAQLTKFPAFATFVKQKRTEHENLLLVDAGDRFSGNPYVDNAPEKGEPMITLMNKLGYSVAAFGNHDFDYGQTVLNKRLKEADFKLICGNINSAGSEIGQPDAYTMVEVAGLKLCFLSLIQTGSDHIPATNPGNLANITFDYFKAVLQKYKSLDEEADAFIALTHLGYDNDSLLAVAMPELDAVIGGHSHTLIRNERLINGVLVSQAGSNLSFAGITTLKFKGKKLIEKTYALADLSKITEPDAEVKLLVDEICNRPEFKEVVGQATKALREKEHVASLMTDAMCDAAGCDFAFYNKGGVRINSMPQGDITVEMLYKIEPFSNYIVMHELTLAEMKDLILNRFNGLKNPADRGIDLYISKGKYTILNDAGGLGLDVAFVDKSGNALKEGAKKYKVGLSNYVNSTYNFVGKGKGIDTGITITDAMIGFVKKQQRIEYDETRTFIGRKKKIDIPSFYIR